MFQTASEDIKRAQQDFVRRVGENWALVTAGTSERFNTMTIGWGSAGVLWSTPVVTVYIHPRRFTHTFMVRENYFSVQLFDESHKRDLAVLGSKSGRDGDKVALTTLSPKDFGHTVGFEGAQTTLICRKLYTHHMDLAGVPTEVIERFTKRANLYDKQAHTAFVGEVIEVALL